MLNKKKNQKGTFINEKCVISIALNHEDEIFEDTFIR